MKKYLKTETATVGAGCFWGVEELFRRLPGVIDVCSGYTGGDLENPTYQDICTGKTGHAEVVRVEFDAEAISYNEILNYFWRLHDPTTLNAQGGDHGTQYRSVIYYHSEEQKKLALKSKSERSKSGLHKNEIVTEISEVPKFYMAESYHQSYYRKKYENGQGQICHFLREK